MAVGELILHRFNGDEVFRLKSATLRAWREEDGIRLDFEVGAEGPAVKTLPDTARYPAEPTAEVAVIVESLDANSLVGRALSVPTSRTRDDQLASIYYYEHQELNANELRILERNGDLFRVSWTAMTRDINDYDGSKPETKVTIEAWFWFEELEKWRIES